MFISKCNGNGIAKNMKHYKQALTRNIAKYSMVSLGGMGVIVQNEPNLLKCLCECASMLLIPVLMLMSPDNLELQDRIKINKDKYNAILKRAKQIYKK